MYPAIAPTHSLVLYFDRHAQSRKKPPARRYPLGVAGSQCHTHSFVFPPLLWPRLNLATTFCPLPTQAHSLPPTHARTHARSECTSKLHEKLLRQCRDLSSLAALAISEVRGGGEQQLAARRFADTARTACVYTRTCRTPVDTPGAM